jgi:hypothetical protein
VTFIRNEPNAMRLFATCGQAPDTQGSNRKTGDGGTVLAPPSSETIILKRTNTSIVSMQKSKSGDFTDPGAKLSYCGQDAQRKYAEQKTKK